MEKNAYVNHPPFTGRNVKIEEIAAGTGKSAQFLREGLKRGLLHFGYAIPSENGGFTSFYCPDKLVWEELGYFRDVTKNGDYDG
jgi:hypothetical protein